MQLQAAACGQVAVGAPGVGIRVPRGPITTEKKNPHFDNEFPSFYLDFIFYKYFLRRILLYLFLVTCFILVYFVFFPSLSFPHTKGKSESVCVCARAGNEEVMYQLCPPRYTSKLHLSCLFSRFTSLEVSPDHA